MHHSRCRPWGAGPAGPTGSGGAAARPTGATGPAAAAASGPGHAGRRRLVVAAAKTPNYYDVLGVDVDATDDEIKAAFRRKAKELHPDVNKQEGAEGEFRRAKAAYETLSDAGARRRYDEANRLRRINFFRDVLEEEEQGEEGEEGRRGSGWPGRRGVDPWEVHRRMWDDGEQQQQRAASAPGGGGGADGAAGEPPLSPEEMFERLSRVMGSPGFSPGALRDWQSGRMDPFGSGSSEAWHRRVQEQTSDPRFGGRAYGAGRRAPPGGPSEWAPFRPGDGDGEDDPFERRQGWANPVRPEWQAPRRRWEEEEGGEAGGRRGGGRGIPGGGDGFRGKPL